MNRNPWQLTGLSVGLWLLPSIVLPDAAPAVEPQPPDATANKLDTKRFSPVPPKSAQPKPIVVQPPESAKPSPVETPPSQPELSPSEPTPRLYGEPEPQPTPALADDPLEQLSTDEWVKLLSEDAPQPAPHPPNSGGLSKLAQSPPELGDLGGEREATHPPNSEELPEVAQSPPLVGDLGGQSEPDPLLLHSASPGKLQTTSTANPPFSSGAGGDRPELISQSAADLQMEPVAELPRIPSVAFNSTQRFDSRRSEPSTPQSPPPVGFAVSAQPNGDLGGAASAIDLESDSMAQVTSVSQLSDVQPTDWAYQALQSLVQRYGVIQGYPDGLFRGDRALTRFEFAAGVNAAMDRMTELIANQTENAVPKSDLEALNRIAADFASELTALRGQVDDLEARVEELAAQQFSTTVVLNGQVTFGLADAWGGDPPGLGETNTVFAYLAQLQLAGSFSENDAFRIELESGNFAGGGFANPQSLNTQMALLNFQTDTDTLFEIGGAEYRVAIGDRLVLTAKPVGFSLSTVLSPNTILSSASQGALSRFASEPSVFKIGSLDAGLGLDWLVTDRLRLQMAYGARNASDPLQGLFRSDHRAFGVQLLARPAATVTTGIAYVSAFAEDGFLDTFTGSTNADTSGGFEESAAIQAVSGSLQWQIVPGVVFGTWGGLTVTDSLDSDAVAVSSTYLFSLAFPDTFGRQGDLLGLIVGQPLRLRYGLLIEREDDAAGLHYELFYRIRVNDNIAVIPGVFVVTDPGHVAGNDTIVVAALRTAFSF